MRRSAAPQQGLIAQCRHPWLSGNPVGGGAGDPVFQVIHDPCQKAATGLQRQPGGVRRHDEIAIRKVGRKQGMVRAGRFRGEDIEPGSGEVATSKSLGKIDLIDKRAPADIKENGPGFMEDKVVRSIICSFSLVRGQ